MGHIQPQPGTDCFCNGEITCDGTITIDTCLLTWNVTGDYFAVELRVDDGTTVSVISTNPTGTLNEPNEATYSLWVKCKSGDDWKMVASVYYTRPPLGVCETCCEALGYASTVDPTIAPITITMDGDPLFALFNGTYAMYNNIPFGLDVLGPCEFGASFSFTDLNPATECVTVAVGATCAVSPLVLARGAYCGTMTYAFPRATPRTFDVYAFPHSIEIVWDVQAYTVTISIVAYFYLVRTSPVQPIGSNECCIALGDCTWTTIIQFMNCGQTYGCEAPATGLGSGTGCNLTTPAAYTGWAAYGSFAVPTLNNFCVNIVR